MRKTGSASWSGRWGIAIGGSMLGFLRFTVRSLRSLLHMGSSQVGPKVSMNCCILFNHSYTPHARGCVLSFSPFLPHMEVTSNFVTVPFPTPTMNAPPLILTERLILLHLRNCRFPVMSGLMLPEDEVLEIKCKPQERMVEGRNVIDFQRNS